MICDGVVSACFVGYSCSLCNATYCSVVLWAAAYIVLLFRAFVRSLHAVQQGCASCRLRKDVTSGSRSQIDPPKLKKVFSLKTALLVMVTKRDEGCEKNLRQACGIVLWTEIAYRKVCPPMFHNIVVWRLIPNLKKDAIYKHLS